MAEPETKSKSDDMSKIKDIINSINASSSINKLGMKVDYAPGSKLEGSIEDLKRFASLQVSYLQKMVGYQEIAIRDARLASVSSAAGAGNKGKGDGEKEKDAVLSLLDKLKEKSKDAGAQALTFADAIAAGIATTILGPMITSIGRWLLKNFIGKPFRPLLSLGGSILNYAFGGKQSAAQTALSDDLIKEEKAIKVAKAAEASRLAKAAEASRAAAVSAQIEAEMMLAKANAQVLTSEKTGKQLYGNAEQARRSKLLRKAEEAFQRAAVLADEAATVKIPVKTPPSISGLKPASGGAVRAGGRILGGALRALTSGPALALQVALEPSMAADATITGAQVEYFQNIVSMLVKGNKTKPDVKKALKALENMPELTRPDTPEGAALQWLSNASDQELSNFAASVMRSNLNESPFNPANLVNPSSFKNRLGQPQGLLSSRLNNRDRQNIDVLERGLIVAPTTPAAPTVVIIPAGRSGGVPMAQPNGPINSGNVVTNNYNMKPDPAKALMFDQVPGGGPMNYNLF